MSALTQKKIPDSRVRMGRPPLKSSVPTHKMLLRMPEDMRERIAALVGEGQVASFIREAVERELERREAGKPV